MKGDKDIPMRPGLVRDYELWTLIEMGAVSMSPAQAEKMPIRTYNHIVGFELGKQEKKERQMKQKQRQEELKNFNQKRWGN